MNALHAKVSLANARVTEVENDRDRYYAELMAAEARMDRTQGVSAQAVPALSVAPEKEESKPLMMEEVKVEESDSKVPTLALLESNEQTFVNGHGGSVASEADHWKNLSEISKMRNEELAEELAVFKLQCSELTSEVRILRSVYYSCLDSVFSPTTSWHLPV